MVNWPADANDVNEIPAFSAAAAVIAAAGVAPSGPRDGSDEADYDGGLSCTHFGLLERVYSMAIIAAKECCAVE